MMPTDPEIDALDKRGLMSVCESHGLPVNEKMTAKELRPWARAMVHGVRSIQAAEAPPEVAPAPEPTPPIDTSAASEAATVVDLEPAPQHVIPEFSRFQMVQQIATYLARSNLTPEALRGKPNDVGHILLKANDLGIPLTTALDQIYVIKGRTGMEAKLMRTLIRRDGHLLQQPYYDGYKAIVHGTRTDTGEEADGEFTLDDAVDFDLIAGFTENGDGTYTVRPIVINGKQPKPQWVKDTKNMLIERATSRLGRWLFSECLGGITYTPDELGWGIDVEVADEVRGDGPKYGRAGEEVPTMTIGQQRKELGGRLSELPEDLQASIKAEWAKRNFPKVTDLPAAAVRTVRGWVEEAEATVKERESTDGIPDADVVDEGDSAPGGSVSPGDEAAGSGAPDHDATGPALVEDRQEAGEPGSGEVPRDAGAAQAPNPGPGAASPAPDVEPDPSTIICAANCGDPLDPETDLTVTVGDLTYHDACAPFPGEGP
jgi:hypothetical protein